MTDHRKEITPTSVVKSTGQHLTSADLMKINQVPRQMMPDGRTEIHVHQDHEPARSRGDQLLRDFVPYFVIATMSLILLGGITALLGMVIPMFMAAILALVSSFVSIILSIVATIIAGVVAAVGIGYLQTINRRYDHEDDQ